MLNRHCHAMTCPKRQSYGFEYYPDHQKSVYYIIRYIIRLMSQFFETGIIELYPLVIMLCLIYFYKTSLINYKYLGI